MSSNGHDDFAPRLAGGFDEVSPRFPDHDRKLVDSWDKGNSDGSSDPSSVPLAVQRLNMNRIVSLRC